MTATTTGKPVTVERLRLAVHESGHAVAAVLLGHRCNGASINVAGGGGVAFRELRPLPPDTRLDGSMLLLPSVARDRVIHDIAMTLAGPVAEQLYGPHSEDGYTLEVAKIESERIAEHLEADGGFRQRLEQFEVAPPLSHPTDSDDVFRVGNVWCGSSRSARLFVEFALAETVALIRSRQFGVPLRAVVDALLVHGALTGDQVHELVETHNPHVRR
jgi:hypothetical protein